MTAASPGLRELIAVAEAELEAALGGASLCSVSRSPHRGAMDVKEREGRWYTLQDIQRRLDEGIAPGDAITSVLEQVTTRTPAGEAWITYRIGALGAVEDARDALGLG
jgi:hypothetical protein